MYARSMPHVTLLSYFGHYSAKSRLRPSPFLTSFAIALGFLAVEDYTIFYTTCDMMETLDKAL